MPKISIVSPVYNVEQFIDECINSVINQTNDDWELILVDDCSADNSGKICDEYAHKDNRIKVLHLEENKGVLNARNVALDIVSGEYVGFLDSDDWIENDYVEKLTKYIEKNNPDVLAFSHFNNFKHKETTNASSGKFKRYSREEAIKEIHNINTVLGCSLWSKIYKKGLVTNYKTDEEIVVGEDYSMLVNILFNCEYVDYIDVPLYHYRQRASSVCNIGYTDKRWITIQNYFNVKDMIVAKYLNYNDEMITFCVVQELALLMAMGSSRYYDDNVARKIVKSVKENFKSIMVAKNSNLPIKVCALLSMINPRILYFVGKIRKGIKKNNLF